MADQKTSQLVEATTVADADLFLLVQNGVSKKTTKSSLLTATNSAIALKADAAATTSALAGKEPTLSPSTSVDYYRGDKTWVNFATNVRSSVLTGLSLVTNIAIDAADTVLSAFGKLQKQITDFINQKGAPSGLATLDANSFLTLSQHNNILSFANLAAFPVTGASKTLYIAVDTGYTYWWTGTIYSSLGSISASQSPVMAQTNPITGAQELVGPDGTIIEIGATHSVTSLQLSASVVLTANSTIGTLIPFNTAGFDDLLLYGGTPGYLNIPQDAKKIRLAAYVGIGNVADEALGTYRKLNPTITLNGTSIISNFAIFGVRSQYWPAQAAAYAYEETLSYDSGWIDLTTQTLGVGNNTISLPLIHDSTYTISGTVEAVTVMLGSRMVLHVIK